MGLTSSQDISEVVAEAQEARSTQRPFQQKRKAEISPQQGQQLVNTKMEKRHAATVGPTLSPFRQQAMLRAHIHTSGWSSYCKNHPATPSAAKGPLARARNHECPGVPMSCYWQHKWNNVPEQQISHQDENRECRHTSHGPICSPNCAAMF